MDDNSYIIDNIESIKTLSTLGNAVAQNQIGYCYCYGIADFNIDYVEAVKWFLKAAEQGLAKSQCNMGYMYQTGKGVAQDSEKAVEWYTKAANQGYARAQHKLGWCYGNGDGVKQDYKKAAEWFTKAANQGYSDAQLDLGYLYEQGEGVRKNLKKAVELYRKSAEQDNSIAQCNLAKCYELGNGIEKNLEKAVEWYAKAAELGNCRAQTCLGYCYEKGLGTTANYEKAAEWYSKAAQHGFARALNNLGFLYENGWGVEKDYNKAFELYSKSAAQGYINAFANLGFCYENGLGARRNFKVAFEWYSKAANEGNQYSKNALKRIKERVEEEKWMKGLDFSTRQKIKNKYYSRVIPFGNNFIVKHNKFWGIVDKDNVILLPINYTRVHWFDGGYASIQINNKWGLVNNEGVITIEPQYDILYYLAQDNVCDVELGDDRFIVDVHNKTIFRVPGAIVRFEGEKLVVCSERGWQLFNIDGTPFSKMYSHIHYYREYYIGYDGDRETLIKKTGEEVELPKYEMGLFEDHITQFRIKNKYGIIDDNANILVPNQYDYITLGSGVIAINEGNETKDNDRYFLSRPWGGKWYFWNYKFNEIAPYRYDDMGSAYKKGGDGKVWFGKRDGHWYQITPDGEQLFANDEAEYKKKKSSIERERKCREGQFAILEDPTYKEDGRKLFVRACDGKYIRKFYFTPYLPLQADGIEKHWKIGDFFVNIYGQEIPNPHAFKMPKQKKPRYVFRLNPNILKLEDKEIIELFVDILKAYELDKNEIMDLCVISQTRKCRAVFCDWLIRKYKRNKKAKFESNELGIILFEINEWLKKKQQ